MLHLTQLCGFAAQAPADVTPEPFSLTGISDAGFVAVGRTNTVTVQGVSQPITLRLSLSTSLTLSRTAAAFVEGALAAMGASGTFVDVVIANGQTLQFELTNALDVSTWSGTATLTNLSDNGTVLAAFTFSLQDTGSGGGGGGGGGGGDPP